MDLPLAPPWPTVSLLWVAGCAWRLYWLLHKAHRRHGKGAKMHAVVRATA